MLLFVAQNDGQGEDIYEEVSVVKESMNSINEIDIPAPPKTSPPPPPNTIPSPGTICPNGGHINNLFTLRV